MQVFNTLSQWQQHYKNTPTSCALGMFDGVHLAHQLVIESAVKDAQVNQTQSCVVTFANHPQSVLAKTATKLLGSLEDRLARFADLGVQSVLVLAFDETLMNLSAEAFVNTILVETLNAKFVSVGYDHRYGKNRAGDGQLLTDLGQQLGFKTCIVDPIKVDGQIVSSTLIRKLLTYGDPVAATQLLGRPFKLSGLVIHGDARGNTIGFPTANLQIAEDRLIPAHGVYAGWASWQNQHGQHRLKAVCNIGTKPTFGPDHPASVEVHILDFEGQLYDQTLSFEFCQHLRAEQRFSSVEDLIRQLHQDCSQAKALL